MAQLLPITLALFFEIGRYALVSEKASRGDMLPVQRERTFSRA
jgi:hypothetical protein